MTPRMPNPATLLPDAQQAIRHLYAAMNQGGLPQRILGLVHLRTSQINGCGPCVHMGVEHAVRAGETQERLHQLAAWHDASCYTDAERAALAVTEAATRLSDRSGPAVPDAVWDEAARHFDERQLAALVVTISTTNFFNRLNATTRQPAGQGG